MNTSPEGFQMHEAATGKSTPIREATDEQLAKNFADANKQHEVLVRQVLELFGHATNAAKAAAVIGYEIDRRSRTLTIASNLSSLRKQ